MSGSSTAALPVLEVESLAHGGDGVAREAGGRVVFLPRTAPGDRVRVELVEERERWARGRVVELLSGGPARRQAPCPHYERCGGCQLQHVEPSAELEAKRRAVQDTLERIGDREVRVPPPATAGPRLGYRNRVSFTLRRGGGDQVVAGYHRLEEPDRLVDVPRCPLAEPAADRAWAGLRDRWGPGADRLPGGRELRLTLRATAGGEVGLLVEGGDPGNEPEEPGGEGTTWVPDGVRSVHWLPAGGELRKLAGADRLRERWRDRTVKIRPGSFLQVNRFVADRMEAHLDRLLGPELQDLRVLDLHAGIGLRAIRWAEAGARAVACEREPGAVADGEEAAARAGVEVDFVAGEVEDHLPELLPADAAVVNPPRRGLSSRTCQQLAAGDLGVLGYVSCEPSTLARDLDRLGARWRLASIQPFDAFPQTAHVETVAWLERTA